MIFFKYAKSAIILCSFFGLLFIFASCKDDTSVKNEYSDIQPTEATFVGGTSCKSCHEEESALWENSHHDQAMKIAATMATEMMQKTINPIIIYLF